MLMMYCVKTMTMCVHTQIYTESTLLHPSCHFLLNNALDETATLEYEDIAESSSYHLSPLNTNIQQTRIVHTISCYCYQPSDTGVLGVKSITPAKFNT